jgi:hypothetical protein
VLTADIGSHVDTFLELVADNHDDKSTIDVIVDISGNFDSLVIGLVCMETVFHQLHFHKFDPICKQ